MFKSYKVSTDRTPAWRECAIGTLLISVGQPYHRGKIRGNGQWAARHFKCLHVLVADTLQRHNGPIKYGKTGKLVPEQGALDECGKPITVSIGMSGGQNANIGTEEQFRGAARRVAFR